MRTNRSRLCTLFGLLSLAGCWSSSSDASVSGEPEGGGGPDSRSQADLLEAFCQERAELECAGEEACCSTAWEANWAEICRTQSLESCLWDSPSVLEGHVAVLPERIDVCRATLQEHYAACPAFSIASQEAIAPWQALDENCDVLQGLLGEEEDCRTSIECADGLLCRFRYASIFVEPQKCLPPAPDGSACQQDRDCAEGLRCLGELCQAPRYDGERCHVSELGSDCDLGLFCPDGVCEPLRGIGDACERDEECGGWGWFTQCSDGVCIERPGLGEMTYCWDRDGEDAQ